MGGIVGNIFGVDTDTLPTRELWYIFPEAVHGLMGDYAVRNIGWTGTATLSGFVPWDFPLLMTGVEQIALVFVSVSTIQLTFQVDVDYAGVGQLFNTHTATQVFPGFPVTANILTEIDLVPLFANLSTNDYLGVRVTNNTPDSTMWLLGVRIRY